MTVIRLLVVFVYFLSIIVLPDMVFCVQRNGAVTIELSQAGQCACNSGAQDLSGLPLLSQDRSHNFDIQITAAVFTASPRSSTKLLPYKTRLINLSSHTEQKMRADLTTHFISTSEKFISCSLECITFSKLLL
ncbi:hypothetical protein ACFL27_11590 [candidate division CSSED10-310 bacterium]|uniref:Uncharacterized protein n=1 Tax=candidate division CSSED10-310 bacterium TaxID=2855610 RepID=A0ABV6YXB0_UNCC1